MRKIKDIKKGCFFTLKDCETAKESNVWVRGDFDHSSKKYMCYKFSDINHEHLFSGEKLVCIDFDF